MPDVLYAVVGDGEERAALEALVGREGLDGHVQFLGEPNDATLVRCYQQCDLFVLPNRQVGKDIEGFGMVLLEAQACGKPIVAGASGGTAETMRIPETGRVVCCDGPDELARVVTDLLGDPARLACMGAGGTPLGHGAVRLGRAGPAGRAAVRHRRGRPAKLRPFRHGAAMKPMLKGAANGLALLLVLPCFLIYRAGALVLGRQQAFAGWSQAFGLLPGLCGVTLRRAFYRLVLPRAPPTPASASGRSSPTRPPRSAEPFTSGRTAASAT